MAVALLTSGAHKEFFRIQLFGINVASLLFILTDIDLYKNNLLKALI
jgi:hypothetical protein